MRNARKQSMPDASVMCEVLGSKVTEKVCAKLEETKHKARGSQFSFHYFNLMSFHNTIAIFDKKKNCINK